VDNIMRIKIPSFTPNYDKNTDYGYKNIKGKNLEDLLYKVSNGYCMYCYSKIVIDSKRFGQLEHAIEKRHSLRLVDCVPNIGLTCSMCNLSFKKVGDSGEIFTGNQLTKYESCTCTKEKCKNECSEYKKLKRYYLKKRKIILQPIGVNKNKHEYKIQYNLLKLLFEPCSDMGYVTDEINFINEHITKFNLNDSKYRTRELLCFCEDIINGNTYYEKGRYNNFIVDLFIDKIRTLNNNEIMKLCSLVYTIGKAKGLI